jgi:hypothetical protein
MAILLTLQKLPVAVLKVHKLSRVYAPGSSLLNKVAYDVTLYSNKTVKDNRNIKMKKFKRYMFAVAAVCGLSLTLGYMLPVKTVNAEESKVVTVYKNPSCGCCKKWVKHMQDAGFKVKSINQSNMIPVKNTFGVNVAYRSCHTAKVGKYFIEGHVPAADIKRMLKDNPDIKGLAVPGMVTGSPGMEGSYKESYEVLAIDKNDNYSVYSSH